ncbi:hypothetical protein GCM10023192_52840 [Amycolatopsis samaneae]
MAGLTVGLGALAAPFARGTAIGVPTTGNQPSHSVYSGDAPDGTGVPGPAYPPGTILRFSGIVFPGTAVVYRFYQGSTPGPAQNPFAVKVTSRARSDCVVDERDGDNSLVFDDRFPKTTMVVATYRRWEDSALVQQVSLIFRKKPAAATIASIGSALAAAPNSPR